MFIQINAKQLKRDNQMFPKNQIVLHPDYIVLVIWVILLQMLQYLQFYSRLVLKLLFVPDELNRHYLLSLVVLALEGLAKTALAEEFYNLKPVAYVVLHYHVVVTPLVVITKVMLIIRVALYFLSPPTDVPYLFVI